MSKICDAVANCFPVMFEKRNLTQTKKEDQFKIELLTGAMMHWIGGGRQIFMLPPLGRFDTNKVDARLDAQFLFNKQLYAILPNPVQMEDMVATGMFISPSAITGNIAYILHDDGFKKDQNTKYDVAFFNPKIRGQSVISGRGGNCEVELDRIATGLMLLAVKGHYGPFFFEKQVRVSTLASGFWASPKTSKIRRPIARTVTAVCPILESHLVNSMATSAKDVFLDDIYQLLTEEPEQVFPLFRSRTAAERALIVEGVLRFSMDPRLIRPIVTAAIEDDIFFVAKAVLDNLAPHRNDEVIMMILRKTLTSNHNYRLTEAIKEFLVRIGMTTAK